MTEFYHQTKSRAAQAVAPARIAVESCVSLFMESPSNPTVKRKPVYDELARSPIKEPLNRDSTLYPNFLSVLTARQIPLDGVLQEKAPYWKTDTEYNMLEVFGTSAQFTDHHGAPLPKTTLPPREDLESFIDTMLKQPDIVTVDKQFDILLDVTNNNVIGAANLGMIATRFMSRFADFRAYPEIAIDGKKYTNKTPDSEVNDAIRRWNSKIAKFETYDKTDKNDGLGDNYYFWSHMFGTLTLNSNGPNAAAMSKIFERGTELMIFAKYTIARRRGAILPHFEASHLGKAIGFSLLEQAKETKKHASWH